MSVNNDAQYTNAPKVKLHLVGPLSATSVLVSNDGGFGTAQSFIPQSEIAWTLDSSGPLKIKATDSNSGVAGVQVTTNKRKPGKLLVYKKRATAKVGKGQLFVRARDRAKNFSPWRKVR